MEQSSYNKKQIEELERMEQFHFWQKARNRLILSHLKEIRKKRVLDIGCGTGALVSQLAQKGYQAVGIDSQEEGLARRKIKEPHLSLFRGNAVELPFGDTQFDVAILADVLEHLDESKAFKEALRVVVPGGTVLITVPAFPSLWSERDIQAGHLKRYVRSDIQRLAKQFNCQIQFLGFYQCLLFPLFLISRLFKVRAQKEQNIPAWLNRLLLGVNIFEVWLGNWIQWPWGSSIIAVIKKGD